MKILKLFTLAAVALLLCTCGSDPVPGPGPEQTKPVEEAAYVKLGSGQSASLSVGYDKTDIPVSFSTNKSWTAEVSFGASASGWVILSERNGSSGSRTLIASVSENNENSQRSAVITIKAGTASATITISQEAFKSEFSITPKVAEVEAEGGTVEVSVTSNIGYHASTSVDWIHEMTTKATETKSMWFIVDANESSEPRSGVIIICNDNEVCIPVTVNQAAGEATITISTNSLEFGYDGGESQITVKSNSEWTAECSADWCYVTPSSETGECTVTVKVDGNTEKEARSATVVFKAGENSKTLTISQKPFEAVFDLSPKSHTVDAAGGTVEVSVTSNIGYHASTNVDWIHEMSTKAVETKSMWFIVDANESTEPRSGVIVICNDNEVCIPVTVNQAAGEASISISTNSLEFGYDGGESRITVKSNSEWTTECSADWCSVTPSSETGECTVTVKVGGNTKKEARSATVVFKAGENSKTLTVSQKPFETVFDLSPKSHTIDAAGGTLTVTVTSNIGYNFSCSVDWIHEEGIANGNDKAHIFRIDENKSTQSRTGAIVFCNDEQVCVPVEIIQAGTSAFISVSPSILNFTSQGGKESIDIVSNTGWSVSQKPEWCTVSLTSGSGKTAADVIVAENGRTSSREGKIVFTAGDATAEVTVKQQAGEPELEVSETDLLLPESGDNVSFTITSNTDWIINTGASWLSSSVSSGSGNVQVTLTAGPNPEVKARTAEVTVKTEDGTLRKTITVTQSEGEAFLELDVYTLQFDHLERCAAVKVTSNDSWSAVSSASWCTVQKIASGGFLDVCVKANDTGKNRTARITVKTENGGVEKTITVSQSTPEENEGFGDDGQINWD